jgi:hypothetical protein
MIKIKLELQSLVDAVNVVTKTAPPRDGNITMAVAKGKLKLTSVAELSRCFVFIPSEVTGEGEFSLPLQALNDATKGRQNLELTYDNTVLTVKSGSYKADLATVDVIPVDDLGDEERQEWKVTAEQGAWLTKALRGVALRPTTLLSPWMPVGVKLDAKSAFVACYDTQRLSWLSSKEITGNLELLLPIDTMQSLMDVFSKGNFIIRQGKSQIQIVNKLTEVWLAVPTADDLPTLADVQAKIKEAVKITASTFQTSKEALASFIDNAKAVIGKDRAEILFTGKEKGVELLVKTGQGQVKNVIKGSGKGTFKIDYEYMQEVLAKAGDEIVLNVVTDAFLSIKLSNSTAIVALNQS